MLVGSDEVYAMCVCACAQVLPVLRDAAGMEVEVHMTQSARHATDLVRDLPLHQVRLGGHVSDRDDC